MALALRATATSNTSTSDWTFYNGEQKKVSGRCMRALYALCLPWKALEHASVTALKFSRLASDAGSGSGERSKNASSSSSETASSPLVRPGVDEGSGSNVTFGRRSAAGDRHSFTLLYNPCQIYARMGIVSIFGADSTAAYVFNFSTKKEIRIHVGALRI